MSSEEQTKKMFLLGSVVLGGLVVLGLIWAVSTGNGGGGSGGTGPVFDDENAPPVIGSATSTLVVRVYGDFECPACRVAEAGFQYARQKYKDQARFIWKDFPLMSVHPKGLPAANAARCAEAEGKFWEYHDKLYAEQPVWSKASDPTDYFISYAVGFGLNKDEFAACLKDEKHQNKIMADLNEGQRNGVNGTPTFFFNDKKVVGVLENKTWDEELGS